MSSASSDSASVDRPSARMLEIAAPAASPRVDRFLADAWPALSRARIQALMARRQLLRDGAVLTDVAAPVRPGERFSLSLPEPVAATPAAQEIPLHILHEDDDLIVLDKPAGLVVHPAPGSPDGTLVNALLAHCGASLPGIGGERRPGIVHRLDKDTSGVMVVAKSELALATLSAAFAARDLERVYVAICWGRMQPAAGAIDAPIGRDPRDRKRMAVVPRGKAALTHYVTDQSWHGAVSLLRCRLATGRTHQIRVHLASHGHPLVGDPVYLRRVPAAAKLLPSELCRRLLNFPRQALHAATLGFAHPRTGAMLLFTSPLPGDIRCLIEALQETPQSVDRT